MIATNAEAVGIISRCHRIRKNADRHVFCRRDYWCQYDRAIELKPNYADAYNNRGIAYAEMTRFDEAVASYTRCLSLRPNHVDAHLNRALTWLRQGNFALGWAAYESRLRKRSLSKRPQLQPAWNGFPPRGLRILLIAEQGLGDSLQFIRYAPLLKQMGATVIFECPEKLLKLFAGMPGLDVVFPHGTEAPAHDMHAALMSLPGLLGTTLETIPAAVPYLQADPARVERWGRELAEFPGFKVGIHWQGNPGYAGDFHRSMPLRHFAPLAQVPGRAALQPAEIRRVGAAPGARGRLPGGRPGEPARRGGRQRAVPGYGGGAQEPRPLDHLRHGGRAPGGGAGGAGVGAAVDVGELAVESCFLIIDVLLRRIEQY